jgi:RNA polymerase sigma-70 factor (ECF subfamily)
MIRIDARTPAGNRGNATPQEGYCSRCNTFRDPTLVSTPQDPSPATPSPRDPRAETSLTLLERLRANDGEAWRAMVRLYTPLVLHWCARGGVRGADADDVAQEVFSAAATHVARFRRDRPSDSFRAWLRGITRNMVLQHFRKSERHPRASGGSDALLRLQEVEVAADGPEDEDPAEELDGLRRRALELVRGEFEERTWQAFWKTVVEGRSPVDIAADMGVSPTAVRMAKSRILRRLKEEFGELIQ